jgi:hypothetical protein
MIDINEHINKIEDNVAILHDKIEEIMETLHIQDRVIKDFSDIINTLKMQNTRFM